MSIVTTAASISNNSYLCQLFSILETKWRMVLSIDNRFFPTENHKAVGETLVQNACPCISGNCLIILFCWNGFTAIYFIMLYSGKKMAAGIGNKWPLFNPLLLCFGNKMASSINNTFFILIIIILWTQNGD